MARHDALGVSLALESGVIDVEATIEAWGRTVLGIKQDGSHESRGAIAVGAQQVGKVWQVRTQRGGELVQLVGLRVRAREDGRVRSYSQGRLGVGVLKDDGLARQAVERGSQPVVRPEKAHAVRPRRVQGDKNDVGLSCCPGRSRERAKQNTD